MGLFDYFSFVEELGHAVKSIRGLYARIARVFNRPLLLGEVRLAFAFLEVSLLFS